MKNDFVHNCFSDYSLEQKLLVLAELQEITPVFDSNDKLQTDELDIEELSLVSAARKHGFASFLNNFTK